MLDKKRALVLLTASLILASCGSENQNEQQELSSELEKVLRGQSAGLGLAAFQLPSSDDYDAIPQDPANLITADKVALGKLLFHETGLALNGVNPNRVGEWSCATCHQAKAGFKAGVIQGIAEGGEGFGLAGEGRIFAAGFDASASDPALIPDVQPLTSPAVLNVAYQEVMLWNGQFGNPVNGLVNVGVAEERLLAAGTPKAENARRLAGVETQAVAGLGVHRMRVDKDSPIQTNGTYQAMFEQAFPNGSEDVLEDIALAIAAYERTILANQAPFQRWLNGEEGALSEEELRGALLFFGAAGCHQCHRGPALSSEVGALASDMFMAIGFADFDPQDPAITGVVDDASAKGRGGFTGNASEDFQFKIPQLYNLLDTDVFGHGGSFQSVREVVAYKNAGVPQKQLPDGVIDSRFLPLGLTAQEMDELTAFIEVSLYDPNLVRYQPDSLPSESCFPNNDPISRVDLDC